MSGSRSGGSPHGAPWTRHARHAQMMSLVPPCNHGWRQCTASTARGRPTSRGRRSRKSASWFAGCSEWILRNVRRRVRSLKILGSGQHSRNNKFDCSLSAIPLYMSVEHGLYGRTQPRERCLSPACDRGRPGQGAPGLVARGVARDQSKRPDPDWNPRATLEALASSSDA